MHTGLIADASWLEEEMATFRCLVVGLIDEQVRVTQIVPAGIDTNLLNPFGDWVVWSDSAWSWLRGRRLPRRAAQMRDAGVDVIHALDGSLWDAALRLAGRLGAAAVLNCGGVADLATARRLAGRMSGGRIAVTATTEPLHERLAELLGGRVALHLVRPPVHLPSETPPVVPADAPLSALISGTGRPDADYEALFEALRRIVAEQPEVQLFLDCTGADQHPLWKTLQRFDLLANVSLVPKTREHRQMILAARILIHPQPLQRTRGLTLHAMAYGLPVLARTDPTMDFLIRDRTAWLVDGTEPDDWYRLIRQATDDPPRARHLGDQAREWIRGNCLASNHVARILEIYRSLVAEPIKFPATG